MIGPGEEPQRQLSGSAAAAACVAAWVFVLAAALLVVSRWSGWPGSRLGLVVVSATALTAMICISLMSRRRGGGAGWTGPTTWTVPTGRTVALRRERQRRLEHSMREGRVEDDDRTAAAALARERLADAGAGTMQAAMPAIVGTTNLATASAWSDGTVSTAVSAMLVAAGAVMMLFRTRAVLQWRRLARQVAEQPSPHIDFSRR